MALRKAKPLTFRPTGLSDSQDGTNQFAGAMQILTNLVPNPATDKTFVPRPAATVLIDFVASSGLWCAGSSCEVLMWPPTTDGNVSPLVDIEGNITTLTGSFGVTPDDNSLTYALDFDVAGNVYALAWFQVAAGTFLYAVPIFAPGATGNVAPIHRIAGAATGFPTTFVADPNDPPTAAGLCLDGSGNIYVGLWNKIYKFPAGSDGNVASSNFVTDNTFGMPNDGAISAGITSLKWDAARSWIWVSFEGTTNVCGVSAYDLTGTRQRHITSASMFRPTQVTIGSDARIYTADRIGATNGFPCIQVYAANADGLSVPVQTIQISTTGGQIVGVAIGSDLTIYGSALLVGGHYAVMSFDKAASGLAVPLTKITGTLTRLDTMANGAATFPNSLNFR